MRFLRASRTRNSSAPRVCTLVLFMYVSECVSCTATPTSGSASALKAAALYNLRLRQLQLYLQSLPEEQRPHSIPELKALLQRSGSTLSTLVSLAVSVMCFVYHTLCRLSQQLALVSLSTLPPVRIPPLSPQQQPHLFPHYYLRHCHIM